MNKKEKRRTRYIMCHSMEVRFPVRPDTTVKPETWVCTQSPASSYRSEIYYMDNLRQGAQGAQSFSPLGPRNSAERAKRFKHSAWGTGITFATKFLFGPDGMSSGSRSSLP